MNYLWKLKQLKGDTVCLIQLVCLKSMACLLHHCIRQAVLVITTQLLLRAQNLESLLTQENFYHQCKLMQILMEVEGRTCQVTIPWLTDPAGSFCGFFPFKSFKALYSFDCAVQLGGF